MTRQNPQSGELWQHYKGHKYWILGIGQQLHLFKKYDLENSFVIYAESWIDIIKELQEFSSFIVKHSEEEKYFEVRYKNNQYWILYPYVSPLISKRVSLGWARLLPMFMEILNDNNGDQSSNWYRFDKLEI